MAAGLGTRNIVADWRLVDLARDAVALLHANQIGLTLDQESWADVTCLERSAQQQISNGGFNWRHGSVYVSAARDDAMRYARNDKGSELLTLIGNALAHLPSEQDSAVHDLLSSYPDAKFALARIHRPRIVCIQGVPVGALRDEKGGDPMPSIYSLERHIRDGSFHPALLQFCRFELVESISAEHLTVEFVSAEELDLIP
jgi:hypothetical protein